VTYDVDPEGRARLLRSVRQAAQHADVAIISRLFPLFAVIDILAGVGPTRTTADADEQDACRIGVERARVPDLASAENAAQLGDDVV
jgi:hypothetical protein